MADAPRLAAATATEPTGYAPYSVTAILAVILTAVFLVTLLLLGWSAYSSGHQLVEPLLLVFPAGILVLAFAARRQILNSEGTRAGLRLCTFAWWSAVLGGCGYAAYLGGRMIGVQSDTKDALVGWVESLKKGDPIDPRNPDFHRAFQQTLDVGRQQSLDVRPPKNSPRDIEALQRGFLDDLPTAVGLTRFRQLDLVRVLVRNREFDRTFTFDGMQSWAQDTSGLRAKSAGTLKTPEGEFKLNFDMMRQLNEGRPTWRVVVPSQGFVGGLRVTPYGQRMADLEFSGRFFVYETVLGPFAVAPSFRPKLLDAVSRPGFNAKPFLDRAVAGVAVVGWPAVMVPEPAGYETRVKSQLFVPLDRIDGGKDGDPREKFFAAWREGTFERPGTVLKETPDAAPLMLVTEKGIEMRVPVEIKLPRTEGAPSAARGAVVLGCDDPAFVAKLNELRRAAATDPLADPVPSPWDATVPWFVRHIESDMRTVSMPRPQEAPGRQGGQMPGGG